jgi:hypothetical protein
MKRVILVVTIIWFCLSMLSGVMARQHKKQQMPKQNTKQKADTSKRSKSEVSSSRQAAEKHSTIASQLFRDTTAVLLRVFRCFAVGQVCNLPQACSGGNAAGYKPALRAGAT